MATSRRPSAKLNAPAMHSAVYSPSESPFAANVSVPARRSCSAAWHAMPHVKSAGWLASVRLSCSCGPAKQRSLRRAAPRLTASSAVRNRLAAAALCSTHALPMPTACAPWPGHR